MAKIIEWIYFSENLLVRFFLYENILHAVVYFDFSQPDKIFSISFDQIEKLKIIGDKLQSCPLLINLDKFVAFFDFEPNIGEPGEGVPINIGPTKNYWFSTVLFRHWYGEKTALSPLSSANCPDMVIVLKFGPYENFDFLQNVLVFPHVNPANILILVESNWIFP